MAENQGIREAASTAVGIGSNVLGRSSSVLMPYIWAILGIVTILGGGYLAWDKIKLQNTLINSGVSKQIQRDQNEVEEFRERSDRLHTKGLTDEDIDRILNNRAQPNR